MKQITRVFIATEKYSTAFYSFTETTRYVLVDLAVVPVYELFDFFLLKPHFFTKTDQKLVFSHKKSVIFCDETDQKSELVSQKRLSFRKKSEFH